MGEIIMVLRSVPINTSVVIKAFGEKKSGKSYLIDLIKKFLEHEGFVVVWDCKQDDESLYIENKRELFFEVREAEREVGE